MLLNVGYSEAKVDLLALSCTSIFERAVLQESFTPYCKRHWFPLDSDSIARCYGG